MKEISNKTITFAAMGIAVFAILAATFIAVTTPLPLPPVPPTVVQPVSK